MSSIDTPAVPVLIPGPASGRSGGRRMASRAAVATSVFVGRLAMTGFALALSAAAIPVVAVYTFIWLAQH